MRCTSCTEHVTPVAALDIDGTMAQYHATFFNFLYRWTGCGTDLLQHMLRYDGSVEISDWLEMPKRTYQDAKLAFRAGGFKRWMPAFEGLEHLVGTLRNGGAEVWVTTTRPWMRMDNIDEDTREWLKRNRVNFAGLLFDEDKYGVLCERIDPARIVLVLEDQPDQYDRAAELQLPVWLRTSSYNRAIHREHGCATLPQAAGVAANQIKLWREQHDG